MNVAIFSCKNNDEYPEFGFADTSGDIAFVEQSPGIKSAVLPDGGKTLVVVVDHSRCNEKHSFKDQSADAFWAWIWTVLEPILPKSQREEKIERIYLCHHRGGGMPWDIRAKSYDETTACREYLSQKDAEWKDGVRICDVSRHNKLPKFLFGTDTNEILIPNDLCAKLDEEIACINKTYNVRDSWRSHVRDQIQGANRKAVSSVNCNGVLLVVGRDDLPECHNLYKILAAKFEKCSSLKVLYVSDIGVTWGELKNQPSIEIVRRISAAFRENPTVVALVPPVDTEMNLDKLLYPWCVVVGEVLVRRLNTKIKLSQFLDDVINDQLVPEDSRGDQGTTFEFIDKAVMMQAIKKDYYEVMREMRHG